MLASSQLLSDGSVRWLYQFEDILSQPLEAFMRGVRRLSATDDQHVRWCGEGGDADGTTFNWTD